MLDAEFRWLVEWLVGIKGQWTLRYLTLNLQQFGPRCCWDGVIDLEVGGESTAVF